MRNEDESGSSATEQKQAMSRVLSGSTAQFLSSTGLASCAVVFFNQPESQPGNQSATQPAR